MRLAIVFIATLGVAITASPLWAQCDCGYPEHRRQPCQRCIEKHVYVPVPCDESKPESGQPESGGYQAPPPTGTLAGPASGLGLEGLSIEIPRMTLSLPTIHFPCFTRYRRQPRMLIDETVAPFVAAARNEFSLPAPESGNPPAKPESGGVKRPKVPCDTHCTGHPAMGYPQHLAMLEAEQQQRMRAMEDQLNAKVDRIARAMEMLAATQQQLVMQNANVLRQTQAVTPTLDDSNAVAPAQPNSVKSNQSAQSFHYPKTGHPAVAGRLTNYAAEPRRLPAVIVDEPQPTEPNSSSTDTAKPSHKMATTTKSIVRIHIADNEPGVSPMTANGLAVK